MFVSAYLHTAIIILNTYDGSEPFHHFLKKYFAANKKFGSRDRKQITQLCYSFFRLGKALPDMETEEKLLIALFLCGSSNAILNQRKPELNAIADENIEYKLQYIQQQFSFNTATILPFKEALTDAIDHNAFCVSFLIQPNLYLRIRPAKQAIVQQKLEAAGYKYEWINTNCIALPNTSKVDEVLKIDDEVVIQDRTSQQVLQPIKDYKFDKTHTAWDCCAASGGKSLLLKDTFPDVNLTVSDVRKSILVNLQNRFKRAGIKNYKWLVTDLAADNYRLNNVFDLIICDAPCSGSGTWSRTPEQLYFFDIKKIDYYSSLQRKIVSNAVKSLKHGGVFVYITCSVFKEENENVVTYIQQELKLQLLNMQYFKGYTAKADTLFVATFRQL